MLTLDKNRAVYVNNKSVELLNLLVYEEIKPTDKKVEDYKFAKNKKYIVLSNPVGPKNQLTVDQNDRIIEKFREFDTVSIGLDKTGFAELRKLISNILKEPGFSIKISEDFLIDTVYDWLIQMALKDSNIKHPLSEHIIDICNQSIEYINVFVPILFLETDVKFIIGATSFAYIEEKDLAHLSSKSKNKNILKLLDQHKGQLYGVCCFEAEKEKAIELSIEHVTLSIDILRLLSPTVEQPDFRLYFDVDTRNIHQITNHIITYPYKDAGRMFIKTQVKPKPFIIEDTFWKVMNEIGLKYVHDFIIKTMNTKTELDRLIHKSITNFSRAIACFDLHERTVQLFTVLESLILIDENAAVIDSICKYLPKIISKDLEERKLVIRTVREMYKVRSSMIHHATKKVFDLKDLQLIQSCCRVLIFKFIDFSIENKTKLGIMKEIDDLIISA